MPEMSAVTGLETRGSWSFNNTENYLRFNDERSFGHQVLSKMGWSKGKGLGKNENGIVEHIKVGFKNDNKGVGYQQKLSVGVHQADFDDLLRRLNKDHTSTKTDSELQQEKVQVNLEQRSKGFKNRLHYQRFIRGKDVSKYSEKDMECIFGPKSKEKSKIVNEESASTFKSSMSMTDYFATKMAKKAETYETNSSIENQLESCSEKNQIEDATTCNKSAEKEIILLSSSNTSHEKKTQKTSKKSLLVQIPPYGDIKEEKNSSSNTACKSKKRKRMPEESSVGQLTSDTTEVETDVIRSSDSCNKKSKRRKISQESEQPLSLEVIDEIDASSPMSKRKKTKASSGSKKQKCDNNYAKLKSCLKNAFSIFGKQKKQVSFNENVSYRIFDSDNEELNKISNFQENYIENDANGISSENISNSITDTVLKKEIKKNNLFNSVCQENDTEAISLSNISNCFDADSTEETGENFNSNVYDEENDNRTNSFTHIIDSNSEVLEKNSNSQRKCKEKSTKALSVNNSDAKLDDFTLYSQLPVFPAPRSNFQNWIDSQRQSLKPPRDRIKKKILRHTVLKSTNLSMIKGYGHW